MSMTTSIIAASQVRLSPNQLGISQLESSSANPASIDTANRLLQKNHDENHVFWRDLNGHNHMAHCLLTILAMGANPSQLQEAYSYNPKQRPLPTLDNQVVKDLYDEDKFYEHLHQMSDYTNYLTFFETQIESKGWRAVIQEFAFSRTRNADAILAGLYEGAYHPIIHLGLGIEFEQPSIIAEGLAQAATHSSAHIDHFLFSSEKEAMSMPAPQPPKLLIDLLEEVRQNDTIRTAPRWTDFANKVRDGIIGRAGPEIAQLASQFRVEPSSIEQRMAEMISNCAYTAGAAQREGKPYKIDFFHMHDVTSSIFLTVLVRQDWIDIATKVRLVEWKGRLDMVWYAASGSAKLDAKFINEYKGGPSEAWGWEKLYEAINSLHDDGHVAKFVRAIKNGEDVCKPFEQGGRVAAYPVKGNMWLQVAKMAYDTTSNLSPEGKWIWATGFDQPWDQVPDL
ncbi:MAG: hypothetical protein M1820_010198 [Bogoriella megaspora]|nr:MAG: hypothetical protein M1820_010198 [Bogoriella megaspora]